MSPVSLATKITGSDETEPGNARPDLRAVAAEVTRRTVPEINPEEHDEHAGAELDIEVEFRRKMAGLRHLPRRERPFARRAAQETRQLALKALREKRAWARQAEKMLRGLKTPKPGYA